MVGDIPVQSPHARWQSGIKDQPCGSSGTACHGHELTIEAAINWPLRQTIDRNQPEMGIICDGTNLIAPDSTWIVLPC